MKTAITAMSTYASQRLQLYKKGQIHSVYHKAVNLSFHGELFAIQSAGTPLSPVSLISNLSEEEMQEIPVCPGDSVTVEESMLQLSSSVTLSFAQAALSSLLLQTISSSNDLHRIYGNLYTAIHQTDCDGLQHIFTRGDLSHEHPFIIAAHHHLSQADRYLQSGQWCDAVSQLLHLLGLGIGLTPSGDDFLTGILGGLQLCGLQTHPLTIELKDQIYDRLSTTNDISQTFLRCALQEQFSKAVCSLPEYTDASALLPAFQAIGHSSGMDCLCGIYYLLHWFCHDFTGSVFPISF